MPNVNCLWLSLSGGAKITPLSFAVIAVAEQFLFLAVTNETLVAITHDESSDFNSSSEIHKLGVDKRAMYSWKTQKRYGIALVIVSLSVTKTNEFRPSEGELGAISIDNQDLLISSRLPPVIMTVSSKITQNAFPSLLCLYCEHLNVDFPFRWWSTKTASVWHMGSTRNLSC